MGSAVRRPTPALPRPHPRLVAGALFALALLIAGFTMLRFADPFDEGLVLQAARRVTDGQLPYRDFLWPYGPAQPFLLGASFEAFGPSLLGWRILRALAAAAVAAVVFALVAREAGTRLALAGWLAAACAMAQPSSANPFPMALLFGLLGIAVASRPRSGARSAAVAGLLCAAAASWRLDLGAFAAAGALLALALAPGARPRRLAAFAAAGLAGGLLAYGPFLVLAGPERLWNGLLGNSLREGDFWRLPFPWPDAPVLSPPGALLEDLKDVLDASVPALLVAGLALAAAAVLLTVRRAALGDLRTEAGVCLLALGGLAYLLSRTDEFHTAPLLVALAVLLPLAIARTSRRVGPLAVRAVLVPALALVLGLLTLAGVGNRMSALLLPPPLEPIDVPVADGVRAPPGEARALERVVALVQARTRPGEPIYVAARRSDLVRFTNPLVYVLTDRDNATSRDFGLLTGAAAQRRIVAELERARPRVVVRWADPLSARPEPNLGGRASGIRLVDEHLARDYRSLERVGTYEVMVPLAG